MSKPAGVVLIPIVQNMDGLGERVGVEVSVCTPGNVVVWTVRVWQRGVWLSFRPFYAGRLKRAQRKAWHIAEEFHY